MFTFSKSSLPLTLGSSGKSRGECKRKPQVFVVVVVVVVVVVIVVVIFNLTLLSI